MSDGELWFVMVSYGELWFEMVSDGELWFVMVSYGLIMGRKVEGSKLAVCATRLANFTRP